MTTIGMVLITTRTSIIKKKKITIKQALTRKRKN